MQAGPRKKLPVVPLIIAVGVAALVVGPAIVLVAQSFIPPNPERGVARNAHEIPVAAEKLGLRGTLLLDRNREVVAVDVISGSEKSILKLSGNETVFGIAGPNRNGKVIVVVNDMMAAKHRLVCVDIAQDTVKTVFARQGDALWGHAIGSDVALADRADIALVFVGTGTKQLQNPPALMNQGTLQRIDLSTGKIEDLARDALGSEIGLSADGKVAWYVSPGERTKAKLLPGGSELEDSNSQTPVISKLEAGKVTIVANGWGVSPIESDGALLVYGNGTEPRRYDLAHGKLEALPLPDYMQTPKWVSAKGVFVTTAMQTRVADVQFTKHNGLPGPRPMPRIIAYRPSTREATVLSPAIDPRQSWSFGEWSSLSFPGQARPR